MDPRRDTGEGVGRMALMSVIGWVLNLNSLYNYLDNSPVVVFILYVFSYVACTYILNKIGKVIPKTCQEIPYQNPRPRYGKGRYKYTLVADTVPRHNKSKGRPKSPPNRKKYKKYKNPRLKEWASVHKCILILEPSYSKFFDLNYNQ